MEKKLGLSSDQILNCLSDAELLVASHLQEESLSRCELVVDSRKLGRGDCFIAYRGEAIDSHKFIDNSLLEAAGVLVYEDAALDDLVKKSSIHGFRVKNARKAWAYLCAEASGHPQEKLDFIGVTGTNGKTSCVWWIRQLLKSKGIKCLSIGTLGAFIEDRSIDVGHTSPDPETLFKLLALAVEKGIKHVVMEVSSHAIAQERLGPCLFDFTVFTSFSRDHLDYHSSMEDYLDTKLRLFKDYQKPGGKAYLSRQSIEQLKIFNRFDDLDFEFLSYGHAQDLDHSYEILEINLSSSKLRLKSSKLSSIEMQCRLFVETAIDNFVVAYLLVSALCNDDTLEFEFADLEPIPGRLEPVSTNNSPLIFIDYAHTPDAIEQTLKMLKPLVSNSRLHIVFGCGGDRDRGKRAEMAKAAEAFADVVWVTSDNPRSEQPEAILEDIRQGFLAAEKVYFEVDRQKAIFSAVAKADVQDIVLIAGKGHEGYQEIMGQRQAFSDRKCAEMALEALSEEP